jgi:hypothetical protein
MASPLAQYYRDKKVREWDISNWDEFGYFTTNSNSYNKIPLVAVTNRLRKNTVTKRGIPQKPIQKPSGLHLALFG